MDATVECVAVHGVTADRRYQPGERLMLSEDDAAALEAAGAVERIEASADPTPPTPEPRPARDEAPASPSADLPPVTSVKGVGPKTAARLRVLGIDSLAALAALDDAGLERAAAGIDIVGDETAELRRWRDDARAMVETEQGRD